MSTPNHVPVAKKLAPVLIVDEIEACEPFWLRMGFQRTVEVPHEDKLGFVIFSNGPVEVMYQTRASVAGDIPAAAEGDYRTALYIEVESIDAVIANIGDAPVIFERRRSFYGADETCVREPGGSIVTFSQFAEPTAA